MSRIYDDLKGQQGEGTGPGKGKPAPADKPTPMDLFAYAAAKQAEEPTPEAEQKIDEDLVVAEEVPTEDIHTPDPEEIKDTSSPYEEASLFKRDNISRRPLSGVIDPLAGTGGRRRRKDRTRLLVAALSLAGAVVVGLVVILRGRERAGYASDAEAVEEALQKKASVAPASVPMPAPPSPRKPAAAPVTFESLALRIPGAVVTTEGEVKIITFNAGLFTGGARLGHDGRRALAAIARQLTDYGGKLSITVIGCTDNTPMNPGSRYVDNEELGFDRARSVIQFLQEKGGFPPNVFRVLSYGEKWSPYPNDTPANRAKNRTAVLRVSCPSR